MEYATQKEVRHHKEHIKDTIEHLEFYLDCAKNKNNVDEDGFIQPISYEWRKVAELALDLANESDFFDRYEEIHKELHGEQNND